MDFSTIASNSQFRAVVQSNTLARSMYDSLFPSLLFRMEAERAKFPGNIGDTITRSRAGLITPSLAPLSPGQDPDPASFEYEQWTSSPAQYGVSIDSNLTTSAVAIINLFLRNAKQLGLNAGQSIGRVARDRYYDAALNGWTVATAQANAAATTVDVYSLNGFTTARRPDLNVGSQVIAKAVSVTNPLPITIVLDDGSLFSTSVTGFTASANDAIGPGSITISPAIPGGRNAPVNAAIYSVNATEIIRAGGGKKTSSVAGQIFTLALSNAALAKLRTNNVPKHADGYYHVHLDPTSQTQLFQDTGIQRALTAMPDYYAWKQLSLGVAFGANFLENTECPLPTTVKRSSTGAYIPFNTANPNNGYDPFAGQLYANVDPSAASGPVVHRPLFTGAGGLIEDYLPNDLTVTDVGVGGKLGKPMITNNGVELEVDGVTLIFRWPQDRLQQVLSTTWKFIADWQVPTDVATGGPATFKRVVCCEHSE